MEHKEPADEHPGDQRRSGSRQSEVAAQCGVDLFVVDAHRAIRITVGNLAPLRQCAYVIDG
jgi:hypothetical protein